MEELMYIVFVIDSKFKDHDGKVLRGYRRAKEFAIDYINDKMADKAVIGTFLYDSSGEMNIQLIETIGFKSDKKHVDQLDLFQPSR